MVSRRVALKVVSDESRNVLTTPWPWCPLILVTESSEVSLNPSSLIHPTLVRPVTPERFWVSDVTFSPNFST